MSGRARRTFYPHIVEGRQIALDPDESHHVAKVLRLRPGDAISVFDGRGGEWNARIVEGSSQTVRLDVGARRNDVVEARLQVEIVQGACRPDRIEWVLQKGTEIGVSKFTVVPFERTEGADPSPTRIERWRKIVLEAGKQSGRRVLPEVEYRGEVPPLDAEGLGIVLDSGRDTESLGGVMESAAKRRPQRVRIVVGPEGGFESREIAALVAGGWVRAGLGPRVLRTETAGPVAAAIVLHAWGDFGSVSRPS